MISKDFITVAEVSGENSPTFNITFQSNNGNHFIHFIVRAVLTVSFIYRNKWNGEDSVVAIAPCGHLQSFFLE